MHDLSKSERPGGAAIMLIKKAFSQQLRTLGRSEVFRTNSKSKGPPCLAMLAWSVIALQMRDLKYYRGRVVAETLRIFSENNHPRGKSQAKIMEQHSTSDLVGVSNELDFPRLERLLGNK